MGGYPSPLLAAFFPEFAAGLGSVGVRTAPGAATATQAEAAASSGGTATVEEPASRIPVNISELSDRFEVQAALPGFKLDQVEVTFEDNVLSLKASPGGVAEGVVRNALRQEIPAGSYARSIAFREAINPEAVSATMDAGLLTVTLGKQVAAQPRRITIKNPGSN
jgi:HSP20 family protein